MGFNDTYEKELAFQADRRRATVEFIKTVSDLWYDNSIELVLFRNQLIDRKVSEILNLHEHAGEFVQKPISIFDSVEIAQAIKKLNLDIQKVNPYGGAVSLGHPIGASGARIMCTLLNAMEHKNKKMGISSICIGGGEASSMLVRRVEG